MTHLRSDSCHSYVFAIFILTSNSGGIFYPQTSFTVNLVGIPLSHEPYLSIPVDKHSANYISYLRGINLCKKSFCLFHSVSWTLRYQFLTQPLKLVGLMYEGSVFSKCKDKHIKSVEYQVAYSESRKICIGYLQYFLRNPALVSHLSGFSF